ncbi:MAG TPA: thiamine pyrophosphate-dependent enzyme [Gemmataceae bacterium]|jgi:thiamine pyrophosphate-dependent acetolactate synthase large subunit-like protein|nr:thiamine pyrophosphate-dependent enzyme [Gemmataceae bacterium]
MPVTQEDALKIVASQRGNRIVIPTMGSVAIWPKLSDTPLDFSFIPSSMGQGPSLGFGLALAQPERGVIVLCGDGSLLMNLGCLVTIAQHTANLWLVLIDNGLYEVTGGQAVAGAGMTDYAGLARAAGIARVYILSEKSQLEQSAAEVFAGAGPVFVWLKVEGRLGQKTPLAPRPMAEQIQRLREALSGVE